MKNSKYFILAFIVIIFIVGFIGFKDSLPQNKNERVYAILKEYLPYTLEKRLGGFSIVYKDGKQKEKPSNAEIFHITDRLDKQWGKEYLKLENNILVVLDREKKEIKRVDLNQDELKWVKEFFGI